MNRIVVFKKYEDYENDKNEIIKNTLLDKYGIDKYQLEYTNNGKPYLVNSDIYISISNDNGYILVVFDQIPIGADLVFYKDVDHALKKKYDKLDLNDREFLKEFSIGEAIIKLMDKSIYQIFDYDINLFDVFIEDHEEYVISIVSKKES